MAARAAKGGGRALAAAITDLQRVPAAAAAQQTGEQTAAAAFRFRGPGFMYTLASVMARCRMGVGQFRIPRMVVRDHDLPLVERTRVAGGPLDAAFHNRRATFGAAGRATTPA